MSLFAIAVSAVIQMCVYVWDSKKGVSELNKTRTITSTYLVTM